MNVFRQLACVGSLLLACSAGAVTVYSTSFSPTGTESDRLVKYDSSTPGAVTVVGTTGIAENVIFHGLDFDRSGQLYGYTGDRSTFEAGALYRIDTQTGLATYIGGGGVDAGGWIVDITYNPFDQQMYGVQLRGSAQDRATILYRIDLDTGVATKLGEVSPFGMFPGGLAADASGKLHIFEAVDDFIWTLSGLNATTLPNATGFQSLTGNGLAVDWSRDGAMYLDGIENYFPGEGLLPESQFWTVDPSTGLGTKVGTVGDGQAYRVATLAIVPAAIPEPSTLVLFLAGGALVLAWRRARPAS